ncbi:MAG: hypothetical protein Q9M29_06085 [Mariprofundaceae bacterium]|nr:hypothetical protein [Mariprofundaceae bacterium]
MNIHIGTGMEAKSIQDENRHPHRAGAWVLAFAFMVMMPLHAEAKKVYSPIVEEGEIEFEYHLDYTFDKDPAKDGSSRHQFELEYGVTDRWQTAIYGVFRDKPGQQFRYEEIKWENIYQLFGEGERWLDAGLYLEYIVPQASLNRPDAIEFKLLLEKDVGSLIHTANLNFKKELGAGASRNTTIGYAWRSKWQWRRDIAPAVEIYGALGELGNTRSLSRQSHQIGPVFLGRLPGGFKYELGYLFGLTSNSDDGQLKLIVAYEF